MGAMESGILVIALVVVLVLIVLAVFLRFFPIGLWISALASGVHISIGTLVGMRVRRIQPQRLVYPLIKANKAGLDLTIAKLETHFLAGGNVDRVINALIAAQRANIEMPFEKACAIDLAGRDVFQAVQMSVTPKVIETPVVAAIAKDGIELRAKARVTVRTNIDRLGGGAGEETVRPSKFCPSTLRTWMWAATLALSCKWIRPKPIAVSHRPRQRNAVPWLLRTSRK